MKRIFLILVALFCFANCCLAGFIEVETSYDAEKIRLSMSLTVVVRLQKKLWYPKVRES